MAKSQLTTLLAVVAGAHRPRPLRVLSSALYPIDAGSDQLDAGQDLLNSYGTAVPRDVTELSNVATSPYFYFRELVKREFVTEANNVAVTPVFYFKETVKRLQLTEANNTAVNVIHRRNLVLYPEDLVEAATATQKVYFIRNAI